jgi:enterochelin esterase-like enzyme
MKIAFVLLSMLLPFSSMLAKAALGSKERIKVYSHAIEGNLMNDPAEREVTVYLPPSYQSNPNRRYPVLYMLHGFTDDDSQWFGWEEHWINLHEVIDAALADGMTKEMIVVMPNAYNRFKGSMYSSSITIGDWETFVTKELVEHIDANYRTLADVRSRGLAGHSMGGYGTIRLGMKYSDVYSAIYLLSACCMEGSVSTNPDTITNTEAIKTVEAMEEANFGVMVNLASAAAWAPNPGKPPLFLDLPYENDELNQEVVNKISANRILYTIEQYIPNLKKLKAIALDAGTQDRGISAATEKLHQLLDAYQIPHFYESYEGNHINRIGDRIRYETLPFFSENLVFESGR